MTTTTRERERERERKKEKLIYTHCLIYMHSLLYHMSHITPHHITKKKKIFFATKSIQHSKMSDDGPPPLPPSLMIQPSGVGKTAFDWLKTKILNGEWNGIISPVGFDIFLSPLPISSSTLQYYSLILMTQGHSYDRKLNFLCHQARLIQENYCR